MWKRRGMTDIRIRFLRYSRKTERLSLHLLPKFASKMQRIHVGNGQFVSAIVIIPIMIDLHAHRLKIFTSASRINENIDLVFSIKNILELEGIINLQESCFSFLNR